MCSFTAYVRVFGAGRNLDLVVKDSCRIARYELSEIGVAAIGASGVEVDPHGIRFSQSMPRLLVWCKKEQVFICLIFQCADDA